MKTNPHIYVITYVRAMFGLFRYSFIHALQVSIMEFFSLKELVRLTGKQFDFSPAPSHSPPLCHINLSNQRPRAPVPNFSLMVI